MAEVDLMPMIGQPGGPRTAEEADRYGRYEATMQKYDHLGRRDGDDRKPRDYKPDCVCRYCRFFRGERGVRLIMCEQNWRALPSEVQVAIGESCAD